MIFSFDVDGTLTPSRQQMDKQFHDWFWNFCDENDVCLVSGSNHEKTIEQVGADIFNKCVVYACSGNHIFRYGKEYFYRQWTCPEDARTFLNIQLNMSQFHLRTGNHFEERHGMINFSIVGRNASKEEREAYVTYDKLTKERHFIAKKFNEMFPNLEAKIGGETGLDISVRGWDKSQIMQYFSEDEHIVFFGDAMDPTGNDFPLADAITKRGDGTIFPVTGWEQTFQILSSMYNNP